MIANQLCAPLCKEEFAPTRFGKGLREGHSIGGAGTSGLDVLQRPLLRFMGSSCFLSFASKPKAAKGILKLAFTSPLRIQITRITKKVVQRVRRLIQNIIICLQWKTSKRQVRAYEPYNASLCPVLFDNASKIPSH